MIVYLLSIILKKTYRYEHLHMKKATHIKDKKHYKNKFPQKSSTKSNNYLGIQIEDILNYLQEIKQDEINVTNISKYFKIKSDKCYDTLYNKLSILVDIKVLKPISNEILTTNKKKNFAVVTVQNEISSNELLISYKSIFSDEIKDSIVAYLPLKTNKYDAIKAKKYNILSEIQLDENNKVIVIPLFYIQKNYVKKTAPENKEFETVFVNISNDNKIIITPVTFKSKERIYINNLPEEIKNNSLLKIKLLRNNEGRYISTLAKFQENKIDYNKLTICQFNINDTFNDKVTVEADAATNCTLKHRKDIRHLPLITIDGEDAKDFDDAIYAEKVTDRKDTYNIYIAIADVSHYVPKNSEIDKEAQKRGNSIYLPGTVIPMLPEKLSNGWCSLNPNVERGCILATIQINRNGQIEDYKFERALMQSKARLTYNEVQDALNGTITENIKPYMENINSIYQAYKLLSKAREKRQALSITSQEVKIDLDLDYNIKSIGISPQNTANEIVEEFMIAANVAAAKLIAKHKLHDSGLAVYRIHEKPSTEKLQEFQKVLYSLKIREKISYNADEISGEVFNNILNKYKNDAVHMSLNEAILRTQSPAKYSNNNIGHFGLNLKEYCHFTSPIRRYSDLLVHRLILSLIDKENNHFNYNTDEIGQICNHLCITERQAFSMEHASKNRYLAKWYEDKIDDNYEGYISTITNAGMFIHLYDTQASGLLPCRLISTGYTMIDLERKIVKDNVTKKTYKLGDKIKVAIHEANPITGLLTFKLGS